MAANQLEAISYYRNPPESQNLELQDLKLALKAFQKLERAYGPMRATKPFKPVYVSGDIQSFASKGYFESVIDYNEFGALISLAAEIQMILTTL